LKRDPEKHIKGRERVEEEVENKERWR